MQYEVQETMGALFLDVRNRLIGESEVYRGTLSRAAVEVDGALAPMIPSPHQPLG